MRNSAAGTGVEGPQAAPAQVKRLEPPAGMLATGAGADAGSAPSAAASAAGSAASIAHRRARPRTGRGSIMADECDAAGRGLSTPPLREPRLAGTHVSL